VLTGPVWPDAAKMLGCGKDSAYAAAKNGQIPVIRVGRFNAGTEGLA